MKQLFLFLIVMLFSTSIWAQHVNLGVKGGLNLYTIHNDNGSKYDTKASLHIGLLAHIHLEKQLAVQPELLFSAQGAKYKTESSEVNLKLNYLNIPVLLQYMFDNGFRLEAGPQVGFLISAKSEAGSVSVDIKNSIKPVDLGLAFGLSYIKPTTGLGIDLRYNLGLSNINENGTVKSMNRGFQIGILYQFSHH